MSRIAAALGVAITAAAAFGIWAAIWAIADHLAWWQFASLGVTATAAAAIAWGISHAIKADQATADTADLREERT